MKISSWKISFQLHKEDFRINFATFPDWNVIPLGYLVVRGFGPLRGLDMSCVRNRGLSMFNAKWDKKLCLEIEIPETD